MKIPEPSPRRRPEPRTTAAGALCAAVLAGCAPSNSVKSGQPVMVSFDPVSAADGKPVVLTDGTGVVPVPPMTNFLAIFDRLLDAASLEDADGGAKAGVAQAQSGVVTQVVPVTTNYVPNGDSQMFALLPPGPSLTVMPICGLPTSGSVTVSLDLAKLRSHDLNTNAVAATGVSMSIALTMTAPLSVTTDVPPPIEADPVAGTPAGPAAVDATTVFNLTFNTITPGPAAPAACAALPPASSHIQVTAQVGAGAAVPVAAVVEQDMNDPTHWTVSPPGTTVDGPGSWPGGAVLTVTIGADVTDTYGVALGMATNASFTVKS